MHSTPSGTGFPYRTGWFVNGLDNSYHNGILWTYSAGQLLLWDRRYGIVILFNSGLNAFVDYYSFTQGFLDLLNHRPPQLLLPHWFYKACRELCCCYPGNGHPPSMGVKVPGNPFKSRPAWRSGPSVLLPICVSGLVTVMSGRVLSWERIFWVMPSIVIELVLCALVSLIVWLARLAFVFNKKLATQA